MTNKSLDIFEHKEIQSYFKIDEKINEIQEQIDELEESFYQQTMASRVEFNGREVVSIGFNVESNTVSYLYVVFKLEERIERLEKKKRYLNDYLNTLSSVERSYLKHKYSNYLDFRSVNNHFEHEKQAEINLHNEILEINEAINFIYDFPQETLKEVTSENLEESFDMMTELLGI